MFKLNRLLVVLLLVGLLPTYTPSSQANDAIDYRQTPMVDGYKFVPSGQTYNTIDHRSYGQKVWDKALNGFANLTTGVLEIPKSIILTTNQSNVIYGFIGGLFKGMIHTGGRMGVGIADLITAPIPTKPIAYPLYVWDDFDTETTYGDTFRLDKTQKVKQPVAEIPPPRPVAPVVTPTPVVDRSQLYNDNTSKKLDGIFKKEMMK